MGRLAPLSVLVTTLVAVPAVAQVTPWSTPTPYGPPGVTTGDVHRYEMDRLRAQADQNQAVAQSQALNTRLTIQSLQASRQAPLVLPEPGRSLTSEEARRQREATDARLRTQSQSMGQIDRWLDRSPQ